ncbi:hypothetical protein, partial [Streptomyces brasiliscabiei]
MSSGSWAPVHASPAADSGQVVPPPPGPEPIRVRELPLPPVTPSTGAGSCTREINPRGTGCIGQS